MNGVRDDDILATVKYGRYMTTTVQIVGILTFTFATFAFLALLIISLFAVSAVGDIIAISILLSVILVMSAIMICVVIMQSKRHNEIRCWLDDENLCEIAVTPQIEYEKTSNKAFLTVRLVHNDKLTVLKLKCRGRRDGWFSKVVDKRVTVLFSPKYEQIIFLKNPKQLLNI